QSVALEHWHAALGAFPEQVFARRRASDDERPEAAKIRDTPAARADERLQEIWIGETTRHLLLFDQPKYVVGIRARRDDDGAAAQEHWQYRDAEPSRTIERRRRDADIIRANVEAADAVDRVPGEVRVCEHHGFRRTRRAGGEQHQAQIVRIGRLADRRIR